MFIYNPHTRNPGRYLNDYKLQDNDSLPNESKPRQCINFDIRECRKIDPVSGAKIPLLYKSDGLWICQNCKEREAVSKWFRRLQDTEIPTVLPQFRNLKGRLIIPQGEQAWDFGPPNDDPCWQFHSIISAYE